MAGYMYIINTPVVISAPYNSIITLLLLLFKSFKSVVVKFLLFFFFFLIIFIADVAYFFYDRSYYIFIFDTKFCFFFIFYR